MDNFKNNGIISTLKYQLLVKEQMKQEVYDKILIAFKIAHVPKSTVTTGYSLILSIISKVDRMDTDNAKLVDTKKS